MVWLTFSDLASPSASGRRKGYRLNSSLIYRFEAIILSSRNLRLIPWYTLISSLSTGVRSRSLLFAVFHRERGIEFSFLSSASIHVITTHYFDGGSWISQILHYDCIVLRRSKAVVRRCRAQFARSFHSCTLPCGLSGIMRHLDALYLNCFRVTRNVRL